MDLKVMMMFTLIGSILSLSRLGDEELAKIKRHWRNVVWFR
jgi:hypothetical protein